MLIFFYPHQPLPRGFQEQLSDYVVRGGKLLVVDSPENVDSTAGAILEPFGLALDGSVPSGGAPATHSGWPQIPIATAMLVRGGEPFAWLGSQPIAASAAYGSGSVTVVGFGSRFADLNMGPTGEEIPDDALCAVYQVEFSLLRAIVDGTLPAGRD